VIFLRYDFAFEIVSISSTPEIFIEFEVATSSFRRYV